MKSLKLHSPHLFFSSSSPPPFGSRVHQCDSRTDCLLTTVSYHGFAYLCPDNRTRYVFTRSVCKEPTDRFQNNSFVAGVARTKRMRSGVGNGEGVWVRWTPPPRLTPPPWLSKQGTRPTDGRTQCRCLRSLRRSTDVERGV